MIKILEIKELENCFDGSFMKEAVLDTAVSKEFIHYLGQDGELSYYPTFARPFYKIVVKGRYTIKGVEGNKTIHITLNRGKINNAQKYFVSKVNQFLSNH